ncbi:hypothetical protein [Rubritalea tangerina]
MACPYRLCQQGVYLIQRIRSFIGASLFWAMRTNCFTERTGRK